MEHTERPRAMRSRDDYIINFVAYFLCSLVLIATLYPLIYVVSASFSEPSEVINGNIWLLPKNVTLDGYEMILDYDPIWIGYRNTIFIHRLRHGVQPAFDSALRVFPVPPGFPRP